MYNGEKYLTVAAIFSILEEELEGVVWLSRVVMLAPLAAL